MASKILILDDEENYTRMLCDLLEQHRFDVVTANLPEKALKMLQSESFDLVVSDYKMPVMDGADFLKKAREIYPDLPFMLVSGLMNTPELVKVANMSVTLVFEKPLNTKNFLEQVRRFAVPKSDDEVAASASRSSASKGAGNEQGVDGVFDFPKPLFFSAECLRSRRVLQELWNNVKNGRRTVLYQSEGGDAELLVKEVAIWKKGDLIASANFFKLADLLGEAGVLRLEGLAADPALSPVVGVHVKPSSVEEDIHALISSLDDHLAERVRSGQLIIIFIVSENRSEKTARSSSLVSLIENAEVISIPPLSVRAPDIAAYFRAIANHALIQGKSKADSLKLTPEAAFAVLSYEWPGNYSELRSAVRTLISRSEEGLVTIDHVIELLDDHIEFSAISATATRTERLGVYLRMRQRWFIRQLLQRGGISAKMAAEQFGVDTADIDEEGLLDLPLLYAELARL